MMLASFTATSPVGDPGSPFAAWHSNEMSNRFEIQVEGINDASLVSAVEEAIRDSFREMALPGSWRVVVRPSQASGRWDFSIHGLDVRHALSIAVPPHLLPNLIPRRLRESLNRTVSRDARDAEGASARTVELTAAVEPCTHTPFSVSDGPPTAAPERTS